MIRNRMSLVNLLLIVLVAIIFFISCIGYALSLENFRGNEERWVLMGCIFSVFLLSIVTIGIWMKQNMARVALLIILYFFVIGWTILAGLWIKDMSTREELNFRLMPLICSVSMYCILFSCITLVNNPKLKEEFGIREN